MEDDSSDVNAPPTPVDSREACTCSENDTGTVRDFIWDTFNITSEVYLRSENARLGLQLCDHGNSTLNFIKNKLIILKEYKEAIVDLCHNKLDYHKSVEKLEVAWNCVASLISSTSPEATKNLLYWVLRQTLHLMLVGEWTTLPSEKRNNIRITIEKSLPVIKCAPNSINRCEYILQYFDNPWSDKRLLAVLYGEARLLTQSDLDYLTTERGCMIVLRLQKLCETKCDEMAFTLSSKALLALRSVNTGHELRKSSSIGHIYFIFDIYLCLVHKFIGVNKFIEEVKRLGLYDALLLIKRNMNAETDCTRLVKFRAKVAKLSANITIATIMVDSLNEDTKHYYCAILKEWLRMHQKLPVRKFRDIARKLFSTACSSKHLHLACQIIKDMKIDEWGELLLELYVRVITSDLNELELLKSEKTCSAEVIIDSEVNLSYRYIQIADLLKEQHPDLTHECILTAFSLNPTLANYCLVKAAAHQKQKEMKSRLEPHVYKSPIGSNTVMPISSDDCSGGTIQKSALLKIMNPATSKRLTDVTDNSGATVSASSFASHHDVLAAPNLILDSIETIDLPTDIRIDLSVLLSSPRVKFLSWFQTWPDLQIHCQRLLKPGGKLEIVRQGLAVANDHLQFLNLDYDQFRNLPENDGPGIEKGYEIFVESEDEQSNHDSDFVASDEGGQRKKRPKQQRPLRQSSSSSFIKKEPGYDEINAQLLKLSERQASDPTRDPLDNSSIQNLLKQQSHLISPFNTFLLQYLSQTTERAPHSTAELDTLFRMFYIQQLQAQLQLSQSYTRALQQKVSPTKDPRHQSRPAVGKPKESKKRPPKIEISQTLTVKENQKMRQAYSKQPSAKAKEKLVSQQRMYGSEGSLASNLSAGDGFNFDPDKPGTSRHLLSQASRRNLEYSFNAPPAHASRDIKRLESNTGLSALNLKKDSCESQKSKATSKTIGFDILSSKKIAVDQNLEEQRTTSIAEQIQSKSSLKISSSSMISPNSDLEPTRSRLTFLKSEDGSKSTFEASSQGGEERVVYTSSVASASIITPVSDQGPQISAAELPCSEGKTFGAIKAESDLADNIVNIGNSSAKSKVSAVSPTRIKAFDSVSKESFKGLKSDKSSSDVENSTGKYDENEDFQNQKNASTTDFMNESVEDTKAPERSIEGLMPIKDEIFQNQKITPVTDFWTESAKDMEAPEGSIEGLLPIPDEDFQNQKNASTTNFMNESVEDTKAPERSIEGLMQIKDEIFQNQKITPVTDFWTESAKDMEAPEGSIEGLLPIPDSIISSVSADNSDASETSFTEPAQMPEESYKIDVSQENFDTDGKLTDDINPLTRPSTNESEDHGKSLREGNPDKPEVISNPDKKLESDSDSETDDSEGDENPADRSPLKKGKDTDSDTDSSGSDALVVQLPHRTYSRVSGCSDHSNTSHQQNSDQRSPTDKGNTHRLSIECLIKIYLSITKRIWTTNNKAKGILKNTKNVNLYYSHVLSKSNLILAKGCISDKKKNRTVETPKNTYFKLSNSIYSNLLAALIQDIKARTPTFAYSSKSTISKYETESKFCDVELAKALVRYTRRLMLKHQPVSRISPFIGRRRSATSRK